MADEATKAGVIGHSPERIPPSPPIFRIGQNNYFLFDKVLKHVVSDVLLSYHQNNFTPQNCTNRNWQLAADIIDQEAKEYV